MDKYNPQNISSSVKGSIRPTSTKFRLVSSRFNTVSELSSSDLNKHLFGTHDYGQIFLQKGFPVFGELYPYTSYDAISVFNPATHELDSTKNRTITNNANVNVVRIRAGEDRKVITLVDSNFSDISNADYDLFGRIDLSSVYLSPLGLDSCFKVDDRMYWEDTDDDFSVLKYYTKSGTDVPPDPTDWYVNPFFVHGNDRPFLYDTRVNMYSGSSMYPQAFGLKVFVKIYMNTPLHDRNIYSQAMIDKKYHNNGLYGIYELELVNSFSDLEEFKDSPGFGMIRYKSDVLKDRQRNPYATDSLVLHLTDFYENGLIWDQIISEYVRVRDLDIDVVITVEEHTSRLQPEILGIDISDQNSESLNNIDYLRNSQLDQVQVLQSFDPTNFVYFSKKQLNIAEPAEGTQQNKMFEFPLAGGQRINGYPLKNAPAGASRIVKARSVSRVYTEDLDTSNSSYTIVPPPQISMDKWSFPDSYAKSDGSGVLTFYSPLSSGPVVFDDGSTISDESISYLNSMARKMLYYLKFAYVTEPSTSGGIAEDYPNHGGQRTSYHWNQIFSTRNPFQPNYSDGRFLPTVSDLNLLCNGILPTGWGTSHGKNPYGADPEAYGGISYRPFCYRLGQGGIISADVVGDCLGGNLDNFTLEIAGDIEPSGLENLVRLGGSRWFWTLGMDDGNVEPSNANSAKQYVHPSNRDWNRVFNERTFGSSTPEKLSYTLRNKTKHDSNGAAYYTGASDLNQLCLPWEDIMWVYAKDSSSVMTMELEQDRNRIKTVIDFSDHVAWGYDNITAFVGNLDSGDIINLAKVPFVAPLYMRRDIKLLPDLNKIMYELHDPDYIDVVNTFMRGSWKIDLHDGTQVEASNMLTKVFHQWKSTTKDIGELFNAESVLYEMGAWTPTGASNYFATFILLWQYYLYKYYKESIYNRISDDIKIVERSPYTNATGVPYKFYVNYNGGNNYPYTGWSGDFAIDSSPDWGSKFKTSFYDSANASDSAFHAAVSYQSDDREGHRGYVTIFPLSLEALADMFQYIDRWGDSDWDTINIDHVEEQGWEFLEQ